LKRIPEPLVVGVITESQFALEPGY
jgi:hypothetical protein